MLTDSQASARAFFRNLLKVVGVFILLSGFLSMWSALATFNALPESARPVGYGRDAVMPLILATFIGVIFWKLGDLIRR